MKTKSFLLLSLLIAPISLKSTPPDNDQNSYMQYLKYAKHPAAGALAGVVVGAGLRYIGAERATALPGLSHVVGIVTPEEREFMLNNLELLCAILGAMIAEGKIHRIDDLGKATAICDIMKRIIARDLSPQSLTYLARDLGLLFSKDIELGRIFSQFKPATQP